jgi:Zn-dependent M28 family amino/carboxypeptidase
MATARLIADLPQRPRRSIRVILFGAEEFGLLGSRAYVARHRERLGEYVIGSQADAGGEPVWQLRTRVADARLPWFDTAFGVLKPLGIVRGDNLANGGPDMTPFRELGVPVFGLEQDMTDYFDVHHTVNDTLMRVDRTKLDRVVAAWAPLVWLLAESDVDFRAARPAQ